MKVSKIEVKNYRLLKDFTIDLEDDLSLIVGKNNTGKTSILSVLDKFLNNSDRNKISYDDFNIDLKNKLSSIVKGSLDIGERDSYEEIGIELKIYIDYEEDDDLSNLSHFMMNLKEDDNSIVLKFEYLISFDKLSDLKELYSQKSQSYDENIHLFLMDKIEGFFGPVRKKSVDSSNEDNYIDLVKEKISLDPLLNFKYISAKRSVTNKDSDKTLSGQTSRIYKKTSEKPEQQEAVDDFKAKLRSTDNDLSNVYGSMFNNVLGRVSRFGGMNKSETEISIVSTLQHRDLLDGNTTVVYTHDGHVLPENFNGLGYMNLISMIFEIEIIMSDFKKGENEYPSALNLFFIEEPEAHTHPQMQHVFIKNIKDLLRESRVRDDGIVISLQTIVSTHSSHIMSESDFDDVKYFKRLQGSNSVESKSLKNLHLQYSSSNVDEDELFKKQFKFLKQYLTLNRSELFFADKAILIEGDTERILIPPMMKKLDIEHPVPEGAQRLLSQNISIVEVGAHSKTFEKFIDFIGVKTVIITDIDSFYYEQELEVDGETPATHSNGNPKTKVVKSIPGDSKSTCTSNYSLLFFFDKAEGDLDYFKKLELEDKILTKKNGTWGNDKDGHLLVCFQKDEDGYYARSFEDAFFSINKEILGEKHENFPSLTKKWFDKYISNEISHFEFSEKAVSSKPSLAIEILLNSKKEDDDDFSNWKTPSYIEEALLWLREN